VSARSICAGAALGALVVAVLVAVPTRPVASETAIVEQPLVVAVVVMEDKDACSPAYGVLAACGGGLANRMPYLNGTVAKEGITLTAMHEGITGLPCTTGTQPGCAFLTGKGNYPLMFSGDLCNMGCLGSTSPNLFAQMGNRDFKVYEEDWSSTAHLSTPRCSVQLAPPRGYGYSRLHDPATFWKGSCRSRLVDRTVFNFPNLPAGAIVNRQGPYAAFQGREPFDKLTVIVPALCHDQHDTFCPRGATNRTNAWGVTDRGCTEGHQPGFVVGNAIMAGDLWLCRNLQGIRKDVGSSGVVIITWDENANKEGHSGGRTLQGRIPTLIVPGESASGTPGVLNACPSPGSAGCVDGGDYDQTSLFKTLIDTSVGGSPRPCGYFARDAQSYDSCSGAAGTGRPAFDVRVHGS